MVNLADQDGGSFVSCAVQAGFDGCGHVAVRQPVPGNGNRKVCNSIGYILATGSAKHHDDILHPGALQCLNTPGNYRFIGQRQQSFAAAHPL